jgi:hypothetical protein
MAHSSVENLLWRESPNEKMPASHERCDLGAQTRRKFQLGRMFGGRASMFQLMNNP